MSNDILTQKNISAKLFKEPVKAIQVINLINSGEPPAEVELVEGGKKVNVRRIKSAEIETWKQNIDKYRYYMITGCQVIEIYPPDPFPDMISE